MKEYKKLELNTSIFDEIDLSKIDGNIKNLFVVNKETMTKIENIKNFPIKNRIIAIKQILNLLKYIDVKSNEFDKDLIQIHSDKLIDIFSSHTYVDFMKIMK